MEVYFKMIVRFGFGITFLLFFHISCTPKLVFNESVDNGIEYSLITKQETFDLGKEIYLYFTITNKSEEEIFVNNRPWGIYRNGMKIGGFDVRVVNENGLTIAQNPISYFSGRYEITKIEPDTTLEIRLNILDYADINKVGTYNVEVEKDMFIYLNRKKRAKRNEFKSFKQYLKINRAFSQEIRVE